MFGWDAPTAGASAGLPLCSAHVPSPKATKNNKTISTGGRKLAKEVIGSKENNPVLGLRGLRLCMKHRDMFRTQLRALYDRHSAFAWAATVDDAPHTEAGFRQQLLLLS